MTAVEIKIQRMQRSEHSRVIQLLQLVSKYEPKNIELDQIWEEVDQQDNMVSVVAYHSDELAGFGSIAFATKVRGGAVGYLEDIVVNPSFQKLGIGQLIVDELFHYATLRGCYKVSLCCAADNIGFYENCGYIKSGVVMQRFA